MTELVERLHAFLTAQVPEATDIRIDTLTPVSGGNARKAYAFDLVMGEKDGHIDIPCIMLMQAGAGQLESDLDAEFQVLSALEGSGVPAPRALWIDTDGSGLGAPTVIMERVPGETDFLALRAPEPADRNKAIALAFADAAARLHTAPIDRLGFLGSATRDTTAARQLAIWEAQFLKHRMEPHPAIAFAFQWLKTHAPVAERISLVHGDYRLGNFLFEGERITALLDWEMAHLGDPAEDIAWAYRRLWTPEMHVPIEDFVERYHAAGGPTIRPENLLFYRLFGEIKHAVISLTAARSFADGRTRNLRLADRMTLALPCIKQFLDWLPA
ncbi:MAG TPA: phosphotransferase family protein [Alphaproteobacteria bacterium]|nr:phosphotransferase family protein [Alphaproteobacteria bacterium]